MDSNKNILELIEKQFSGTISTEELSLLNEWYESSNKHKIEYENYYTLLKSIRISKNRKRFKPHTHTAYQQFLNKTAKVPQQRRRFILPSFLRYAAVFVITLGIAISSFYIFIDRDSSSAKFVQTIEIPFGSKSKVTLPDGSTVWLNSGSQLSYPSDFGQSNREISLNGEGFFDVARNEELPFNVLSGKVKIEVLGTKFNFKSYLEDENARVTLVEGSLNVSNINTEGQKITLTPNQQATLNKKQEKFTLKNVDAKTYAMWTEAKAEILEVSQENTNYSSKATIRTPNITLRNTLFFDEEPLNQIGRDLERVFNVKIEIQDKTLESVRFYGDFRNDETITEILDIMAKNNNLRYSIENDEIIITRK